MDTPQTDNTLLNEKTIMGHPRGLVILFLTEMWERFSYYGMRGLLVVYLTQHFLFSDERSSLLYGAYTALVYVMTIIGGSLADRYLGARKAVTFGAILLTLGHFGMTFEGSGSKQLLDYQDTQYQITLDARGGDAKQMIISELGTSYVTFTETDMLITEPETVGLPAVIPRDQFTMSVETEEGYLTMLYLSLALLIAGVGFLKANISTIVGSLYGFGDSRRDSGFTIFYMGINMGAFLASIFCGYLGIVHGWKYGFGLAGIGMLVGLVVFLSCQSWLEGKAEPPSVEKLKEKVFLFINVEWMCYLVGLAIIAVSMLLVMNEELVGGILGPIGIIMLVGMVSYSLTKLHGDERSRMLAAIYFILAQIPFWALFEQAGSSLNLLTARLVDRTIFGWSVPGPVFQSLNAGYIFIFAPLVAWLWIWLAKRDLNPSTPVKFALGVAMAGLGFLALVAGMKGSGDVGLTPVLFIFLIYWIHTMGELMVSPVGLSAVTKLAPARIVGMTMGAWFLYSGLSNFLAGIIARTTGAETIGGQMTNVAAAKAGYIEVYSQVGFIALGISVVMLLISPVITKMMHGAD
ncbi:MAG: Dipeptide and tripeptide permease A [Porticoccaceae bacterium UBA1117]|mgnify:FL=1|nr:MAG: Dipeptide and tripeptide permease A [Porticoccaceae bacterium UBA1117]|tara:strand:+ start:321 stop:2048 length:1728 start_codon:yes stop_codon:yes gene_type:complete